MDYEEGLDTYKCWICGREYSPDEPGSIYKEDQAQVGVTADGTFIYVDVEITICGDCSK